jgi:TonB family protein
LGITFASTNGVLHVADVVTPSPELPRGRRLMETGVTLSAAAHALLLTLLLALVKAPAGPVAVPVRQSVPESAIDVRRMVFIAREPVPAGRGGGGGGNRQTGPIRRAQGMGNDAVTLRVARSASSAEAAAAPVDAPSLPALVLDAKPLASGAHDLTGLPEGVPDGASTGPGSGGGVGSGSGTGIGPGVGPGLGPGSGGGTGGGVYRPGGAVSPPRVLVEVKPTYTNDALRQHVQGSVVLELVVMRDGRPSQIRVIQALDDGLDQQALAAASQWRFAPGRVAGEPVDVLVTLVLDFWIR